MHEGPLPMASLHGTWTDNMEVWSVDDDTLYDLSSVTEIILKLRDPRSHFDELILRLSDGSITLPSTGIIQWRAEAGQMGALSPQVYEVIMLLEDATDTIPLIQGSISIVE